ncbi:MAG: MarR family transcriptional regulator [Clostridiales bacterium]|nr:MarR family transcriptional regulator [Clostridiales bacterium]
MKDKTLDIRKETLHMTFIRLNKAHRKRCHEEFNRVGLSPGQPKILDFLLENDGCIQRELSENCNIEPATVTSILANMEKSELIYRTQNSRDKRVLNVFLTDKGKDAQGEVERIFKLIDEECFEGFSEDEKLHTIQILNRLWENIIRGRHE